MRTITLGILFLILTGGAVSMPASSHPQTLDLAVLLPQEVRGWTPAEADQVFDPETIFEYIDGAGEVYRAYGFVKLLGRRYSRQGQPDIIADVFDMGEARSAYGVFTHDLEGEEAGIGQDSRYRGGLLTFWKDRVYASIFSESETEEARQAVLSLGRTVADAVAGTGVKPAIIDLLPAANRIENRVHYFFHPIILNYHFFVADGNLLRLGPETEGVLAVYDEDGENMRALLVGYPDEKTAAEVRDDFLRAYMPDATEPGIVRTENGKWTAARQKSRLLAVVFDAPTADKAVTMISDILNPSKK